MWTALPSILLDRLIGRQPMKSRYRLTPDIDLEDPGAMVRAGSSESSAMYRRRCVSHGSLTAKRRRGYDPRTIRPFRINEQSFPFGEQSFCLVMATISHTAKSAALSTSSGAY